MLRRHLAAFGIDLDAPTSRTILTPDWLDIPPAESYSVHQLARYLKNSDDVILRMIEEGKFLAIRAGAGLYPAWRIPYRSIVLWLLVEQGLVDPDAGPPAPPHLAAPAAAHGNCARCPAALAYAGT